MKEPIHFDSEQVTYFDVDDTLIYWNSSLLTTEEEMSIPLITILFKGREITRYVKTEHVEELKLQKESGSFIIVHSNSGAPWAKAVVEALEIKDFVDVTMSKPKRIYDDKDVQEWMPKRRYLSKL